MQVFWKKGVLRNLAKFAGIHLCQSLFFNKVAGLQFIKKETLAQMFSCEFCEIYKNSFFNRTPLDDCFWKLQEKGRLMLSSFFDQTYGGQVYRFLVSLFSFLAFFSCEPQLNNNILVFFNKETINRKRNLWFQSCQCILELILDVFNSFFVKSYCSILFEKCVSFAAWS